MLPSAGAGLLVLGVCLVVSFVEWVRGGDVGDSGEFVLLRGKRAETHKD